MTAISTNDRQLILGVLARRFGMVTPPDLAAITVAWLEDPSRTLTDRLWEAGKLNDTNRAFLEQALERLLATHGHDAAASLAAIGGPQTLRQTFADSPSLIPGGGHGDAPAQPARFDLQETVSPGHAFRYPIAAKTGRGGMGRVFLAVDTHLGREIAIEELLGDAGSSVAAASSPAHVARIRREDPATGRPARLIDVPVYELGRREDGTLYCATRSVRGRTMATALAECRGLADRLELLDRFVDLCQVVAYAHSRGVIHRDIKPVDVMLGDFGETILLDWGSPKPRGDEDLSIIGAPAAMSPEQGEGDIDGIDERSNIWSLGAVLYEILTGAAPFTGASPARFLGKGTDGVIDPVRARSSAAPIELAELAEKALSVESASRYPTARELAQDIETFQSGAAVLAHWYSLSGLARRFVTQSRTVFGVTATAAFLLLFLAISVYWRVASERDVALAGLSAALAEKARLAIVARDPIAAEVYAAGVLSLGERPDARGVIVGLTNLDRPHLRFASAPGRGCTQVAYSPDGTRIACTTAAGGTGEDTEIALWAAHNGADLARLRGHQDRVTAVAFSPDGKRLASVSRDRTLRLWRADAATPIAVAEGHEALVSAVSFGPTGEVIATGSHDETIRLWDATNGAEIKLLAPRAGKVFGVAMSPDGRYLAAATESTDVLLFDLETGRRRFLYGHTDQVLAVVFSPDGRELASGSRDRTARRWRLEPDAVPEVLTGHQAAIFTLAYSPDGAQLATGGGDHTVGMWQLRGEELPIWLRSYEHQISSVTFSPDGARLATGTQGRDLKVWELPRPMEPAYLAGHIGDVGAVAFSPSGTHLLTGSVDGARLWNLSRLRVESRYPDQTTFSKPVAFASDGERLLYGGNGHSLVSRHYPTGVEVILAGHTDQITSAVYSPDGARIATASHDRSVRIWDTETGKETATLLGHGAKVNAVRFTPDGRQVLSAGEDQRVRVWDIAAAAQVAELTGYDDWLFALAVAPNGRFVAGGGADATILVWRLPGGEIYERLEGHQELIEDLAFSADSKLVASASDDRSIRLWDIAPGVELAELPCATIPIAVAFSPGGQRLVSTHRGGAVRLWNLERLRLPGEELQRETHDAFGFDLDGIRLEAQPTPTGYGWVRW